MELQSLRLQALHIADGDTEKAQAIENYVLGNQEAEQVAELQAAQPVSTSLGVSDVKSADDKGNTGDRNTGCWNTANFSNGFFNTEEVEIINVFDKPCMKSVWDEANKPGCLYFSLTKWIYESEMSDVEKQENPSFPCTGGYLKKYD